MKKQVEIRVQKLHLPVTESKTIYVKLHRGKQAIAMQKKTVDQENNTVEFTRKEACVKIFVNFMLNANGSYQADNSQLVLHSDDDTVIGTCNFDLASYIDKDPVFEKAEIHDSESGQPTTAGTVLISDMAANYPGAYLEFRITVNTPAA